MNREQELEELFNQPDWKWERLTKLLEKQSGETRPGDSTAGRGATDRGDEIGATMPGVSGGANTGGVT